MATITVYGTGMSMGNLSVGSLASIYEQGANAYSEMNNAMVEEYFAFSSTYMEFSNDAGGYVYAYGSGLGGPSPVLNKIVYLDSITLNRWTFNGQFSKSGGVINSVVMDSDDLNKAVFQGTVSLNSRGQATAPPTFTSISASSNGERLVVAGNLFFKYQYSADFDGSILVVSGSVASMTYRDLEGNLFSLAAGDVPVVLTDPSSSLIKGSNLFNGGTGNDDIGGGAGADTIFGGDGDDNLGGSGIIYDALGDAIGDTSSDILYGGAGDDNLSSNGGHDKLYGGPGNDFLEVYSDEYSNVVWQNILDGGEGDDRIDWGYGNNRISGGNGDDDVTGGEGNNAIGGGDGNDYISVGDGNNVIDGGSGDDTIDVGYGKNILTGGAGDDLFWLGAGNDVIDGGTGDNSVWLPSPRSNYVIERLSINKVRIVDSSSNSAYLLTNIQSVTFDEPNTYEVVAQPLDWNAAKEFAKDHRGHLATIGSATENAAVLVVISAYLGDNPIPQTLDGGGGSFFWIGANDIKKEGDWNWDAGGGVKYGFSNWGSKEPDNLTDKVLAPDGQDAAAIAIGSWIIPKGGNGQAGQWNDLSVSDKIYFVVERENYVSAFLTTDDLLKNTASNFDDAYDGTALDDAFDGMAGNDTISGGGGNDNVLGGSGSDTLDGGTGDDTLAGGSGNDLYIVDSQGDVVTEAQNAGADTVQTSRVTYTLPANVEFLIYTGSSAFTGTGNEIANQITCGIGNDTLDGGTGADVLIGGSGDDTYILDTPADKIFELDSSGTDTVEATVTYALGFNLENLTLKGSAGINGIGNSLNNRISGTDGSNLLNGLAGNDTLLGQSGADILQGGDDNDSLEGGEGSDRLDGGKGDDILAGGLGDDILNGGDILNNVGTDTIILSGNLADYLFSRVTGDNITLNRVVIVTHKTSGEKDILTGIEKVIFADVPTGRLLNSIAKSEAQIDDGLLLNTASLFNDTYVDDETKTTDNDFDGGKGDDLITGGTVANKLIGGDGRDRIGGGADSDILSGGDGNDSLDGGTGDDSLTGGKGDDVHVVDAIGDVVTENALEGTDTVRTTLTNYSLSLKAANVEKLIYTGSDNFAGTGNEWINAIIGGAGNDSLDGQAGADILIGGLGNDTYTVDNVGDRIVENAGEGTDTLLTRLVAYSLALPGLTNIENLTYTETAAFTGVGNALDNTLIGGLGNDKLTGGLGNDTLFGGNGDDRLDGGLGEDTVLIAGSRTQYAIGLLRGTVATGDIVRLVGLDGSTDQLIGIEKVNFDNGTIDTQDDTPLANNGLEGGLLYNMATYRNDTLVGADREADPADTILAGEGDDLVSGGTGNDQLSGEAGKDTLSGGAGNDTLDGGIGDDLLDGGVGDDSLSGGLGNDTYEVDGADIVSENHNQGTDTVRTRLIAYVLAANVENLAYTGQADAQNVTPGFAGTGNDLANLVSGGNGADTLGGGLGTDTLAGGLGDDIYLVSATGDATDVIREDAGAGTDTIRAATNSYVLRANVENLAFTGSGDFAGTGNELANQITGGGSRNTLNGLAGNDTLTGGNDSDILKGGDDNDRLIGGGGDDTLSGGLGSDVFVFTHLTGSDRIMDFNPGEDRLLFDRTVFDKLAFTNDGTLVDGQFVEGSAALEVDDRLIYDKTSGNLYYDADGSEAIHQLTLIATLGMTTHPATIMAANFGVVA